MWFEICVILMVIGIVAILLELIMPGFDSFISGVIGILALIASAVLAVIFLDAWFIVAINATFLVLSIFFLFAFIKRKHLHGKIVLNENLSEDPPAIDLSGLIGKEGIAMTALRPYGEADFNGVRVEVCSPEKMLKSGAHIKVIQTQANKVIVALVKEKQEVEA